MRADVERERVEFVPRGTQRHAPAGTPRAIIERLNREINAVLKAPDVRERLVGMGAIPTGGTPEELEQVIRSETRKWKKIIEISGATPH